MRTSRESNTSAVAPIVKAAAPMRVERTPTAPAPAAGRSGSVRRAPVGAEVRLAEAGAEDVAVRLVGPALDPLAGLHGQAARADRSCPLDARRQEHGLSATTAQTR